MNLIYGGWASGLYKYELSYMFRRLSVRQWTLFDIEAQVQVALYYTLMDGRGGLA